MEYTNNYQLPIWAESDRILMEDFNDSYQKLEDALTEHGEALAGKGNCQICCGSYTGTGTKGSGSPNTLTFPGQPLVVLLAGNSHGSTAILVQNVKVTLFSSYSTQGPIYITWEDSNTVSWYAENAIIQSNVSGGDYHYIALMSMAA